MSNLTTNGAPTNAPGPFLASESDQVMSATSIQTETESVSAVTTMPFFFTIWSIFLLLIIILVCLIISNRSKQQEQLEQPSGDEEKVEQTPSPPHDTKRNWEVNSHRVGLAIMIVASTMALGLAIFSILACDFLSLDDSLQINVYLGSNLSDPVSITIFSLGLWSVGVSSSSATLLNVGSDQCYHITGYFLFDWQFTFARASAVIASLLGGVCFIILLLSTCMEVKFRSYIHRLVWPFLLAASFQLFTLFLFESIYCSVDLDFDGSNNCVSSTGVTTSVTSALFWLYCACAAALLPFKRAK